MKSKAITAASAALLSLSLFAGSPALAQTQALDDAVTAQLVTLGFLPGDWVLTEEQMLEIQNVVSSSDPDGEKQEQIKRIVGEDVAAAPAVERDMLDDAVTAQLVTLGFLPGDWVLTEEQMLQIQNVVSSNESDTEKQQQVRRIVGDDTGGAPVVERDMLDDAVTAQLVALGFLPDDWVLTEGQLLELQNVVSSTASEQSKQDQVRKIVEIN